ncbi:hypothetical protein L1277_001106 [Okibacterium sp. HSC-33S16]|nr:hypothetical protein [Okibacterium sp. HSC-33S16]
MDGLHSELLETAIPLRAAALAQYDGLRAEATEISTSVWIHDQQILRRSASKANSAAPTGTGKQKSPEIPKRAAGIPSTAST